MTVIMSQMSPASATADPKSAAGRELRWAGCIVAIARKSMGLGGVGFPRNWVGCGRRVVTGRRWWRQVCCPCAGRRRDRFQGVPWRPACPAESCVIFSGLAAAGCRVAR